MSRARAGSACARGIRNSPIELRACLYPLKAGGRIRGGDLLMSRKFHVIVIGPPGLMRDGLCALLSTEHGMKIAGLARSALEAMSHATSSIPDLALIEASIGSGTGAEAVPALRQRWPGIPVVLVSFRQEYDPNSLALLEHPQVHALTTHTRLELISLIRTSLHGLAAPNRQRERSPREQGGTPVVIDREVLTDREIQVMKLIAAGYRTREMAVRLSVSHKTIEKHRGNLLRKLGLRSATAVTAYAIAHGFWQP